MELSLKFLQYQQSGLEEKPRASQNLRAILIIKWGIFWQFMDHSNKMSHMMPWMNLKTFLNNKWTWKAQKICSKFGMWILVWTLIFYQFMAWEKIPCIVQFILIWGVARENSVQILLQYVWEFYLLVWYSILEVKHFEKGKERVGEGKERRGKEREYLLYCITFSPAVEYLQYQDFFSVSLADFWSPEETFSNFVPWETPSVLFRAMQ